MITGLHLEVLLWLSYAVFLTAVAFLLELVARRSHKRAAGYRNAGFLYVHELDHWKCPGGSQLVRIQTDYRRGITSYRAPASACNSCPLKINCTDSDQGRVVESHLNMWLESELRRFHRGISVTLLALAAIILAAAMVRYTGARDRIALAALLIPVSIAGLKLIPSLWRRWEHGGAGL